MAQKPRRRLVTYLGLGDPGDGPRRTDVSFRPDNPRFAAKTRARRRSNSVMITPEIPSTDDSYRDFSEELAETLSHSFPRSATRDGWWEVPAVPSDFRGLYTVSGMMMNPAGSPPLGRQTKTERFATALHQRLFDILVDLLTAKWVPAPYHISRISSSGLPHMVTDPDLKYILYRRFWEAADLVKDSIKRRDLYPPYERYEILSAFHVGRRSQVDKVLQGPQGDLISKPRSVVDWRGNPREAVKDLLLWERRPGFGMRTRLVYAGSGSVNYGLGAVWSGLKNYMRTRYAFTLRSGSRTYQLMKASRFLGAFSLDVKNFDQNIPRFLLRRGVERAEILAPWVRDLTLLALGSPVMIPNDYEGGAGYLWSGHPLEIDDHDADYGNPSGLGPNFYFNYLTGIFLVAVGLLECGVLDESLITHSGVDEYLRGLNPRVGNWNSGDDNVLLFSQDADRRAAEEWFNSGAHPYFDLEVEPGMTFLGTLYAKTSEARYAYPNPVSQVVNFLAPERGFDSPHRPFAAYGWFARKLDFSSNPAHKAIDAMVNQLFREHFGATLDEHLLPYRREPTGAARVNAATLEYLLNPSVIHYKGRIEELDPALLRMMFIVIEPELLISTAGQHVKEVSYV